tara:strand:+ start:180 stop:1073 length:894 start_codon:yes stop_codon:yes gene_type:complete
MKKVAPIVIFTFKRLNTLKKCVNSLKNNNLAKKSKIYFFSDGPKNETQKKNVLKVREYLKRIKGFKEKKIYYRKNNFGLANNIISGVTKVFNKEEKLIILEDDILVSKNFLKFMNLALDNYKKSRKVWHISGWNYNLDLKIKDDSYFTRGMNCWGWGTWKNRWKYFEKNPSKIIGSWTIQQINDFNFDNNINFYSQITRNLEKSLNTWAVFWYATIFKNKKLCLNPKVSLTKNLGVSSSATNSKKIEKIFNTNLKNQNIKKFKFPKKAKENSLAYEALKRQIKINKAKNLINKLISI